ncbi:MAG: hypothetical protein R6U63_09830 [Longimicrobiales bacterium]
MYVCLWSPAWSTAAASAAEAGRPGAKGRGVAGDDEDRASDDALPTSYDLAPLLAELAPRLRVEREVIWADGRGLDAGRLAGRLVERLAEEGAAARAGVAAVPVTAELAARWGPHAEAGPDDPTLFLVKERTGWGRRAESRAGVRGSRFEVRNSKAEKEEGDAKEDSAHPQSPHRRRERAAAGKEAATPRTGADDEPGDPQSGGGAVAGGDGVVVVEEGREAEWQGRLPVSALRPPDRTKALFDGVGLATVGQLAGLQREAVEVRFGGGVVDLWRAARADDRRLLFDRIPSDRPHGSIDFVDYVLTDPARLVFTANALLGPLCDGLVDRGEHARTLRLELPLANGEEWARTLRPARPTASRETWLRMLRGLLDELTVPDAVAGMRIEVPSTEAAAVRQGDLFDRGFATATAVEAAVARLAERQLWPVAPETDAHPVVERRGAWKRLDLTEAAGAHRGSGAGGGRSREDGAGPVAVGGRAPDPRDGSGRGGEGHPQSPSPHPECSATGNAAADPRTPGHDEAGIPPSGRGFEKRGLALQLMPEPRRITVETQRRRDHEVPTRFRDRTGWHELAHAAGPDRISGGQWEASSYAREYWRCVTGEGVLLWVFRDALEGGWYLHGWWD